MDEAGLLEKLRYIEALFAGATTEGEKVAEAIHKDMSDAIEIEAPRALPSAVEK